MNEFLVSFLVGKTFSLEMLIKEKSVINVRKPLARGGSEGKCFPSTHTKTQSRRFKIPPV